MVTVVFLWGIVVLFLLSIWKVHLLLLLLLFLSFSIISLIILINKIGRCYLKLCILFMNMSIITKLCSDFKSCLDPKLFLSIGESSCVATLLNLHNLISKADILIPRSREKKVKNYMQKAMDHSGSTEREKLSQYFPLTSHSWPWIYGWNKLL